MQDLFYDGLVMSEAFDARPCECLVDSMQGGDLVNLVASASQLGPNQMRSPVDLPRGAPRLEPEPHPGGVVCTAGSQRMDFGAFAQRLFVERIRDGVEQRGLAGARLTRNHEEGVERRKVDGLLEAEGPKPHPGEGAS